MQQPAVALRIWRQNQPPLLPAESGLFGQMRFLSQSNTNKQGIFLDQQTREPRGSNLEGCGRP